MVTVAGGIVLAVFVLAAILVLGTWGLQLLVWIISAIATDFGIAFLWVYGLFDKQRPPLTFGAAVMVVFGFLTMVVVCIYIVSAI